MASPPVSAPQRAHGIAAEPPAPQRKTQPWAELSFDELYEHYFPFVWRCLRAEGVSPAHLPDQAQEVFVIVHRRMGDFENRSTPRTWLYAICHKVAANHRRGLKRKGGGVELPPSLPSLQPSPIETAQRAQAARFVEEFASGLDEAKRSVFVLCLLEGISAPEASEALGVNVNTVYSRLRVVKQDFREAIARMEDNP